MSGPAVKPKIAEETLEAFVTRLFDEEEHRRQVLALGLKGKSWLKQLRVLAEDGSWSAQQLDSYVKIIIARELGVSVVPTATAATSVDIVARDLQELQLKQYDRRIRDLEVQLSTTRSTSRSYTEVFNSTKLQETTPRELFPEMPDTTSLLVQEEWDQVWTKLELPSSGQAEDFFSDAVLTVLRSLAARRKPDARRSPAAASRSLAVHPFPTSGPRCVKSTDGEKCLPDVFLAEDASFNGTWLEVIFPVEVEPNNSARVHGGKGQAIDYIGRCLSSRVEAMNTPGTYFATGAFTNLEVLTIFKFSQTIGPDGVKEVITRQATKDLELFPGLSRPASPTPGFAALVHIVRAESLVLATPRVPPREANELRFSNVVYAGGGTRIRVDPTGAVVMKEALSPEKVEQLKMEKASLKLLRQHAPFSIEFEDLGCQVPYLVLRPAGRGSYKGRHLVDRQAVLVLKQVLPTLRAAHSVGLLHRDVRPSNIIDCSAGEQLASRLADWGLAVQCKVSPPTFHARHESRPVGVVAFLSDALLKIAESESGAGAGVTYSFWDDLEALALTTVVLASQGIPSPVPWHQSKNPLRSRTEFLSRTGEKWVPRLILEHVRRLRTLNRSVVEAYEQLEMCINLELVAQNMA
jgi:serine/threonine protein kinase